MKTNNRWMKALSIFIVISFIFQGVPAFAAGDDPTNEKMESLQPLVPATDSIDPNHVAVEVPVDPTAKFYTDPGLTEVKLKDNEYEYYGYKYDGERLRFKQPIKLIINDLINTFGFEFEQLIDLVSKGLIKFNWTDKRSITVSIDPSVKLPNDAVNLTDPLGSNDLPSQINYQFRIDIRLVLCVEGSVCNPKPSYQLVSANFMNDKGQLVEVKYQNNQIDNVKIYEPNKVDNPDLAVYCSHAPCGRLVKEIQYQYVIAVPIDGQGGGLIVTAKITYHDASQGDVASRDVDMINGRIRGVVEYNKDGKVIAKNTFEYRNLCQVSGGCHLFIDITRVDASGNPLSTVTVDFFANGRTLVTVTLSSGKVISRKWNNPSIEGVLNYARNQETRNLRRLIRWINNPNFNFDFNRDGKLTEEGDYQIFKWLMHNPLLLKHLTPEARRKLDLNHDGVVNPEDVIKFGELIKMLDWVNHPDFNFDFNQDGVLNVEDYILFKAFDGVDGDLPDLGKFLTPEARRKLDLNHDGVVNPEDVIKFGELIKQNERQIELVKQDLINTFGFGTKELEFYIEAGLIKFIRSKEDPLSLTVFIDPSVKLRDGAVNLTDPLGTNELPREINYQLGLSPLQVLCIEGSACGPIYQLESASFTLNGKFYDLSYIPRSEENLTPIGPIQPRPRPLYGDNRLHIVTVLSGEPCHGVVCPAVVIQIFKRIFIDYEVDLRIPPGYTGVKIKARIDYLDGSQGDVASRMVIFENGRIKEVHDFDREGKLMARSIWVDYRDFCDPNLEMACRLYYFEPYIRREDASGNLLSIVRVNESYWWEIKPILYESDHIIKFDVIKIVTVTLPDGTVVSQKMFDPTVEDILNFARKVEQENPIEKLRQELLDRVDEMIQDVQAQIVELETVLDQTVTQLKEDFVRLTASIKSIMEKLEAIMDEPGLSDETRKMISEYLEAMTKFLDPRYSEESFLQLVEHAIWERDFYYGAGIHSLKEGIELLADYQEKVKNAKTQEELEALADWIASLKIGPIFPKIEFTAPTKIAQVYLARGVKLYEMAKEEINQVQKPWDFVQILPDFGNGVGHETSTGTITHWGQTTKNGKNTGKQTVLTNADPTKIREGLFRTHNNFVEKLDPERYKEALLGGTLTKKKEPSRARAPVKIEIKREESNVKPFVPAVEAPKHTKPPVGGSVFAVVTTKKLLD